MENVESQGTTNSRPTVGSRLRQAREAAELSRTDIATQTRIAERHLIAIEEDRFNDLAARTYAVGFSRAYARSVGLDEAEIAEQVRQQLDAEDHERTGLVEPSFEPGDPARVPPVRMAWLAGAGVVIVVGLLIAFWGSFFSPEGELPDLIAEKPATQESAAPAPTATASAVAVDAGPVVMTATADRVWVKVTDASGKQLLQKELAQGESWTVPQDAEGPRLRTGRPDALRFTVGGKPAPAIADRPVTISGVSLAAADVLARGSATPAPQASPARPLTEPTQAPAAPANDGSPAPGPTAGRSPGAAPLAAPLASPRPVVRASRTPSPKTGAAAVPSPIATHPAPDATGPVSSVPAAGTAQSTPSTSPSPRPMVQPVSTVSE